MVTAVVATMVRPTTAATALARQSVGNYALSPEGWAQIRAQVQPAEA
jgi:hypothetical protein